MLIVCVFFQAYENGVAILPESVKENTERIPELLTECRASSTTKGYYRSYMKWVKWLEKNGIYDTMSTMKPLVICVLASLIQEVVSMSVLSSAVYENLQGIFRYWYFISDGFGIGEEWL